VSRAVKKILQMSPNFTGDAAWRVDALPTT
jgi:hypothetical protein